MVTEDAFAKNGRYTGGGDTGQRASVSNECLNPIFDSNEDIDNAVGVGNCGGTISQQDESGSASAPITSQTANPDIELQRATTTQPPLTGTPPPTTAGCEQCFNMLNDAQQAAFMQQLSDDSDGIISPDRTVEELCAFLVNLFISGNPNAIEIAEDISDSLDSLEETGQIDSTTHSNIESCLKRISLLP